MISVEKPTAWWERMPDPETGNGTIDMRWAGVGLGLMALEYGGVVHDFDHGGVTEITIEDLHKKMEELGGRLVQISPTEPKTEDFDDVSPEEAGMYVWPEACLYYVLDNDDGFMCGMKSTDAELFKTTRDWVYSVVKPRTSAGRIYAMVQTSGGISIMSAGVAKVPFEEGNYDEEVVDKYNHVVECINSDSPCGRIVIFDGSPGTGKTYLVRSLLDSCPDALFIITPSNLVQNLADPTLIPTLINTSHHGSGGPIVLVVEDGDQCLVPRAADNIASISALLNLSDGILGAMLDLRIVVTTNATADDMDPAVKRPGRLCRRVDVGHLTREHSQEVYKRLTEKTIKFSDKMTLAEVYRAARDGGWSGESKEKRRAGFFVDDDE